MTSHSSVTSRGKVGDPWSRFAMIFSPPPYRVGREFLFYTLTSFAFQASRFGVYLIGASLLGPGAYGVWVSLLLLSSYLLHLQIGVFNAMGREIPLFKGRGEWVAVDKIRRAGFGFAVVSSLLAGAALVILGPFVLSMPWFKVELLLMALYTSVQQLFSFTVFRLKAEARFMLLSFQQLALALIMPVATIGLTKRLNLAGFILGLAFSFGLIVLATVAFRYLDCRVSFEWPILSRLVAIGVPIYSSGLVFSLFMTVDQWVVAKLFGQVSLGYYGFAVNVFSAMMLVVYIVADYFYPRMAEAYGRNGNYSQVTRLALRQSHLTALLSLPIATVLTAFVSEFVTIYMRAYLPAVDIVRIFAIKMVFLALVTGHSNLLLIVGKERLYLLTWVGALMMNVAFTLLFARWELKGVAFGTVLATLCYVVTVWWISKRVIRYDA